MDEILEPPIHVGNEGLLPIILTRWMHGRRRAIFAARDDAMLRALAAAMPVFLPDHTTLALPAWDNLPYDRGRPSRAVTGRRVSTLAQLAEDPDRPALVLTTPEALLQRVPTRARLIERSVSIAAGQPLDPEWLRATLEGFGYIFDDRVDEPGEAAIRAGAIDVHPAGQAVPVRLELSDGVIASIRRFDPTSQRSTGEVERVMLLPASEGFTVPGESGSPRIAERLLPDDELATLFDLLPDAGLAMIDGAGERIEDWITLVRDAHAAALASLRAGVKAPPPPDRLYMRQEEFTAALDARQPTVISIDHDDVEPALTPAAASRQALSRLAAGDAVVLCADVAVERLRAIFAQRLRVDAGSLTTLENWNAAERLQPGRIGILSVALRNGFHLPGRTVIAVQFARAERTDPDILERLVSGLHIGDVVVEPERGLARLTGLAMEAAAGAPFECLSLAFLGGSQLLLPAQEAGRVWRYGAAPKVGLDRLETSSWTSRRAAAEKEIEATATALVARVREREAIAAPVIEATQPYQRFVRLMPFAPTGDQIQAIRVVRRELAAGRPMLRLVCGDVGFGKTEVALHAAALVALAGHQVAIAAPTTLLARQHLNTFRRRLGGFGLRIESLIRSSRSAEAKSVIRAIADGKVNIVIGTHAIASAQFHDLGLLVIDEEQRFGAAHKQALREKQRNAHALTMTATPLPRSLQSALVGLLGVSLLTQPPASRLPVRSIVVPFDPVVARTALIHEARRGGQSFVVCPRIEDLGPMRTRLDEIVPELSVLVAHGRLRGEELDRSMLDFAEGEADVLLTTNIVETGLDLPNANTMLIWRADRFGMAQLHQLRGRIGRARVRASAYLLTDPEHPPSPSALKRLETVAALDQLGAGFALSLADLDQRGAGDLLGDEQAGHVRLVGTELYHHVLGRALARARGEPVEDDWTPSITLDAAAFVPADFVPEPDLRLEIYRRLSRLASLEAVDEVSAELADRFGNLPDPFITLLDLVRLRVTCRQLGIEALNAGPEAIALSPRAGAEATLARFGPSRRSSGRIILPIAETLPEVRLRRVLQVLIAEVDA